MLVQNTKETVKGTRLGQWHSQTDQVSG